MPKSDYCPDFCVVEPVSRPCNFGLEIHHARSTWVWPEMTSVWHGLLRCRFGLRETLDQGDTMTNLWVFRLVRHVLYEVVPAGSDWDKCIDWHCVHESKCHHLQVLQWNMSIQVAIWSIQSIVRNFPGLQFYYCLKIWQKLGPFPFARVHLGDAPTKLGVYTNWEISKNYYNFTKNFLIIWGRTENRWNPRTENLTIVLCGHLKLCCPRMAKQQHF